MSEPGRRENRFRVVTASAHPPDDAGTVGVRARRIIIVEDDKLLRFSFALFFQTKGFDVVACESAEEALEAMKKMAFDVVISDHGLSGMNGLVLLDRVRAMVPDAIRVLITGSSDPGIADEADRRGVEAFLRKPFTPEEIENALWNLFESRRTRPACAS